MVVLNIHDDERMSIEGLQNEKIYIVFRRNGIEVSESERETILPQTLVLRENITGNIFEELKERGFKGGEVFIKSRDSYICENPN